MTYTFACSLQVLCPCFERGVYCETREIEVEWVVAHCSVRVMVGSVYEPFQWNRTYVLGRSGVVVHVDVGVDYCIVAQ